MLQIYTGDGKGKTTASIGTSIRAKGAGLNVLFCQFLKGGESSELVCLEKLGIEIIKTDENKTFFEFMNEKEKNSCKKSHYLCYNNIKKKVADKNYDLLVIDEIFAAVKLHLIPFDDCVNFIADFSKNHEVILTGRDAQTEFILLANYVSEIKNVKHPYDVGICARKGIEF